MSVDFSSLATGALSFTVALSWNNAISRGISSFFPGISQTEASLVYAVVATIVVVILAAIINYVTKIVKRHKGIVDGDDDADEIDATAESGVNIADGFGKAGSASTWHPITPLVRVFR